MININKILINILGPYICFTYKDKNNTTNLFNTNVISENDLIFNENYIKNNKKIVATFLEELIEDKKVTKIKFANQNIGIIILELLTKNKNINEVYLDDSTPVNFDFYLKIIACKNIKYVHSYTIPKFILEQFDKHKIIAESQDEIFFTSHFMESNNLLNYSKIYYKSNIVIDKILSEEDIEDFIAFCRINKHLKNIHLEFFDKNTINILVSALYKFKIKNTKILIHENITDLKLIEYLKRINKIYGKKYSVELKLVYSDEYISNNLFSQLIVNNIKMCCFIIASILIVFIIVVIFNNYTDQKSVDVINNELKEIINYNIANEDISINKVEDTKTNKINGLFTDLLEVNKDTIGWLKINNTKIDYPVVQVDNNDYYLNNDYYHNKNYNGWIFADYRNKFETLDQNTIIYGHNKYLNETMFGTLNKVLDNSWLENDENLTITFNTLYKQMQWEIFSVYKINNTNDYLITSFSSDSSFKKFLNIIKKRSFYSFSTKVTTDDKILTLSTCIDQNKRLVVHAVLKK